MSASDLTDGQLRRLIELRGGCRCWMSAPCSACCDPITDEEAEELGVALAPAAPEVPPPVWDTRPIVPGHAMAAVRAMCGGAT